MGRYVVSLALQKQTDRGYTQKLVAYDLQAVSPYEALGKAIVKYQSEMDGDDWKQIMHLVMEIFPLSGDNQ